ncbi:hypothetical protein JAAARDRAFT_200402 [Jaapia argillacea MUCL 33604]|uniref:Hydrophobin n=1 Tax=Jaapia argillacea MUCL 33604 TaxID=933084 RepID=A0A067P850_9AGAM|nr:hypothetical protein JAAARDRAFT_200402 [Jaapia argillacea MUCL 33604]
MRFAFFTLALAAAANAATTPETRQLPGCNAVTCILELALTVPACVGVVTGGEITNPTAALLCLTVAALEGVSTVDCTLACLEGLVGGGIGGL